MANPVPQFKTFTGDTAPVLRFTIVRKGGEVVDLTGSTVKFRIKDIVTKEVTNDSNDDCTIIDAENGICTYQINEGDLPNPGCYIANLKVTYLIGGTESSKVEINVEEGI